MQRALLPAAILSFAAFFHGNVHGQWSTSPTSPLVVCTAAGAPNQLSALSDGAGGWYAFWRDKRTNGTTYEIFGQHLDADGNALWTPNGERVYTQGARSVIDFVVERSEAGNLLLVMTTSATNNADTLRAMLLDEDAAPLWPAAITITHVSQGSVIYLSSLATVPTSDGFIIGWYDIYIGGSNGVNLARITNDGELPWTPNGYAIPNAAYGPFGLLPDGADGVMVNWRSGNGIGAGYGTMRVDSTGTNAWPANISPQAGAPGFGGEHALSSAAGHSMLLAYTDQTNKLRLTQVDTAGTLLFDPSPVEACTYANSQSRVGMVHQDGITTLVWADNRPPASNYDLYMQRVNSDGELLLDPEGMLMMHLNTYVPTTGVVSSTDGGAIGTFLGNVAGYSAMRMNADGTPFWDAPVAFCTVANNPFGSEHPFADGEGGIVSFWNSQGGAVLGARIFANGELGDHVGVEDNEAPNALQLHPNPATDYITLSADAPLGPIVITAADGRTVRSMVSRHESRVIFDISGLASGTYLVRTSTEKGPLVQRFMKP